MSPPHFFAPLNLRRKISLFVDSFVIWCERCLISAARAHPIKLIMTYNSKTTPKGLKENKLLLFINLNLSIHFFHPLKSHARAFSRGWGWGRSNCMSPSWISRGRCGDYDSWIYPATGLVWILDTRHFKFLCPFKLPTLPYRSFLSLLNQRVPASLWNYSSGLNLIYHQVLFRTAVPGNFNLGESWSCIARGRHHWSIPPMCDISTSVDDEEIDNKWRHLLSWSACNVWIESLVYAMYVKMHKRFISLIWYLIIKTSRLSECHKRYIILSESHKR